MSCRPLPGWFNCLPGFLLILTALTAWANPPSSPLPAPPGEAAPPLPDGNGLTAEERDRVREVFSRVWTEPEVVAAREAVHQATVRYRETVQAAVERTDPSVAPLLEKMHRNIKFSAGKHRTGPGPGRKWPGGAPPPLPHDPQAAAERILEHEPGLEGLDPAARKRLLDLAHDAMKEKELQRLLSAAIMAKEPPADFLQARRKFRESLLRTMAARDPWVEKVLGNAPARDRARPGSPPPDAPFPPPDPAPERKKR